MNPRISGIISTIIWGGSKMNTDIKEFDELIKRLTGIFGKEYVDNCKIDKNNEVDLNLKKLLSKQKPSKTSIEKYLQEICKTYKVSKFNLLFSAL